MDKLKYELFTRLAGKPLREGDIMYLISKPWMNKLQRYLGFGNIGRSSEGIEYPGPIDNTYILKGSGNHTGEIKAHLNDELDYLTVSEEVWSVLVSYFSLACGQKPIPRRVVLSGFYVKRPAVEVYLTELKLYEESNPAKSFFVEFSKADSIATIDFQMRQLFLIEDSIQTSLWRKTTHQGYEKLHRSDMSIQEAGLYSGQAVMIERITVRAIEKEASVVDFDCPICFDEMVIKKIFSCYNGHSICESCIAKTTRCPSCRQDFERHKPVRNLLAESLIHRFRNR